MFYLLENQGTVDGYPKLSLKEHYIQYLTNVRLKLHVVKYLSYNHECIVLPVLN